MAKQQFFLLLSETSENTEFYSEVKQERLTFLKIQSGKTGIARLHRNDCGSVTLL